ncbi:MAG TPA: polymer-forming cytoskeletal protein [Longimicrobiaceae bacterium]|nr:polymer-forming cytoskeletal protein [Longimicrobiaceae bacterium]
MSLFKKSDEKKPESGAGRDRISTALRALPGENAISIIGPGMQVVGDVLTDGTVRVEGRVEGTLRAGNAVVLGRDGEIVGDIIAQSAVIGGRVTGSITAEGHLELQGTCTVDGVIRTRAEHLQLQEGARFNGQIQMLDADSPVKALPAEGQRNHHS